MVSDSDFCNLLIISMSRNKISQILTGFWHFCQKYLALLTFVLQKYKLIPNSPIFFVKNIKLWQIGTLFAAISHKNPIKRPFMEIVLNTYGTSLSCENEAFVVRNCNGTQRIPTDGVTAILINKGASVTSDAVMLAVDRQI